MAEPYSSSAGEIIFRHQENIILIHEQFYQRPAANKDNKFICRDETFDQLNESVSPCSRISGRISLNHPYGITVL